MTKWNYKEICRSHLGEFLVPEDFFFWYDPFGTLKEDLLSYKLIGSEADGIEWSKFGYILYEALKVSDESVRMFNPAYHNFSRSVGLVESGKVLLNRYEKLTGREISNGIKQAFLFALALQDSGYPGYFLRSQAPHPEKLFRADMGVHCTNEYVSMVEADEQAKKFGFNPPARLFIAHVIASTTFGGDSLVGQPIEPTDLFGCMARLIDVRPKSTFTAATLGEFAVLVGEGLVSERPESVKTVLSNRHNFLGFIKSCMDKVDEVSGVNLTPEEWRDDLKMFVDQTESISDSSMEGAVNSAVTYSGFDHFLRKS